MEFHCPFSNTEIEVFDKINKNHYLIHFHGNNNCGVRNHNNVYIPNVFECTYLHKKHFTNIPELNKDLIPSILDMRNTEDIDFWMKLSDKGRLLHIDNFDRIMTSNKIDGLFDRSFEGVVIYNPSVLLNPKLVENFTGG